MDDTLRRRIDGWLHLLGFLVTSFYLALMGFLIVWVVVPSLGFGLEPVVISSGSMAPLVVPGDVVLVDSTVTTDLGIGTVITFERQNIEGLVTHRIVGLDDDGNYVTRGDANADPDSTPVSPEQVVGIGRLLVPRIGGPALWLRGALPRFSAWLAATALACVVALRPPADEPAVVVIDDDVAAESFAPSWWRTARDVVVAPVVAIARLVTGARSRASLPRRWGPVLVLPALVGAATPAVVGLVAAVITGVTVLILDPAGPEVPVGRWRRAVRRRDAAATGLVPA